MLAHISDLILGSWNNYRRYWKNFLPYILLLILNGIIVFLAGYLGIEAEIHFRANRLINDIIILLIYLASLIFSTWITISLTQTAGAAWKNQTPENWKTSLLNNTSLIIPVIINTILVALIVAAGSILLIVPGIIFFVWYNFSSYEIILNNTNWKKAFGASKALVVGRWWSVALRILAIIIFYTIISSALQYGIISVLNLIRGLSMTTLEITGNAVISLINLLLTPLLIGSLVGLYLSAKENPTNQNPPPQL